MTGAKAFLILITFPILAPIWVLYFAYKLIKGVVKI